MASYADADHFLVHQSRDLIPRANGPENILFTLAERTFYIDDGYSITLTEAPKDRGGRLCTNFALTTPLLPCGLVTLPHMTLILVPCRSRAAR